MRILLTGVSGQVGSALLPRLQRIGTVIPTDRDTLDFAKPDLLAAALNRIAPELIINPAAYTAVDLAEDEIDMAMVVNARAPGAIARWAAARDVPLVHFSTDYVFSGAGERPWREDDAAHPLSAYGATKLAGDHEIQAAGGCHLVLRTSWVYAARGKNFLSTIARLAWEREELRIVADQIGSPTSTALLADAVTNIVAAGIDHVRKRCAEAKGVVHLTASGETTWYGFACAITDGLRARGLALTVKQLVPIRTNEYSTQAKRPVNSRLDLGRWRKMFGQTPPHWETALAPVLDEFAHRWIGGSGTA
jgi:dTDP-4-dehydrorhamnose reductase